MLNCRPLPYLINTVFTPQSNPADSAQELQTQGISRLQYGDLEGARKLLIQAAELDPGTAETHYQLGNCYRRLRQNDEAEASFRKTLDLAPGHSPAWFGLTFLYADNGRLEEAKLNLSKLVSIFSADLNILHQAGGLMGELGLYKEAAALYAEILQREPQARNHLRLGQYYQKMGRYEDAARHLTAAIDLNPDAGAAYLLLANTRRFSRDTADRALLRKFTAALDGAIPSRSTRICLNFALGKMHDDLDEYDEAFGFFTRGNALRHEEMGFVANEWRDKVRNVELIESTDLATPIKPVAGTAAPLFIVGMLRSGTTLLERILASHPRVIGQGETRWMDELGARAVNATSADFPGYIAKLDDQQLATLRAEYLRHWSKSLTGDAIYIVDKNPLNFVYLGLIARLFPEAKILHCQRDARDTSLSVYFQNFANQDTAFAYDLVDIANFHNGYVRMMRHWQRVLPPGMLHSISYEQLTADQENQTRVLLESLGLPWDEACLRFHAQPDGISTASVWQARQPLYTQSVGRWRHYERHLGPLLKTLTAS